MRTQCANCQAYWHSDELVYPIPHLEERVAPGEPMPEGECPACGALCHAVVNEIWVEVADGGLIGVSVPESMPEKTVVRLIDYDWPDDADGMVEIDGMKAVVTMIDTNIRKGE